MRVVVSDGLRSGEATSGAFAAEPDTSLGEDRVIFVRDLRDGSTLPRIMTMQPDGHDVVEPALPTASVYPTDSNGETACTLFIRVCTVQYEDPSWGPDGRIYFSSDLLMQRFDGPDWGSWSTAVGSSRRSPMAVTCNGSRHPEPMPATGRSMRSASRSATSTAPVRPSARTGNTLHSSATAR